MLVDVKVVMITLQSDGFIVMLFIEVRESRSLILEFTFLYSFLKAFVHSYEISGIPIKYK